MDDSLTVPKINRLVLQNLVTGLSDGLILLENDGTIAWANRAALVMHRIESVSELGDDTESYRRNFTLRYRNNHLLDAGQYPLERLAAVAAQETQVIPRRQPCIHGGKVQCRHILHAIARADCLTNSDAMQVYQIQVDIALPQPGQVQADMADIEIAVIESAVMQGRSQVSYR